MCFGPPRDGRATFQRLDTNPRWSGLPDLDRAGRQAIETYLRAYGPATPGTSTTGSVKASAPAAAGSGPGSRTSATAWPRSTSTANPPSCSRDDLDELTTTRRDAVRLLPGHDQWVLGPGTPTRHVVPPARRTLVSRGANLVVAGGAVSGTWN